MKKGTAKSKEAQGKHTHSLTFNSEKCLVSYVRVFAYVSVINYSKVYVKISRNLSPSIRTNPLPFLSCREQPLR